MLDPTDYPLTLFYDGACPICRLEMDRLAARDALHRLAFVDISAHAFSAQAHGMPELPALQALIHARTPDGRVVIGVPALRMAYVAVGLGALVAPTAWPLLQPAVERFYAWFARHRYGLSALGAPLIDRLAARTQGRMARCSQGACDTHPERSAS